MHEIEPFYQWRDFYKSEEDRRSLLYGKDYSEFYFTRAVYNYLIHPQWDTFGSETLYFKVLYVDYKKKFMIVECIGEWNDALYDDFFEFWDNFLCRYAEQGIAHFIFVVENVFNFHASIDKYRYEEYADVWSEYGAKFSFINMLSHVKRECAKYGLDNYFHFMEADNWRLMMPKDVYRITQKDFESSTKRLNEE